MKQSKYVITYFKLNEEERKNNNSVLSKSSASRKQYDYVFNNFTVFPPKKIEKHVRIGGYTYIGDFIDLDFTGNGLRISQNGDVYEGGFVDKWPMGKGTYIWKHGDYYEGVFRGHYCIGTGKYVCGSDTFEGEVYNYKFAKGVLSKDSVVKYIGDFGSKQEWDIRVTPDDCRCTIQNIIKGSLLFKGVVIWPNGDKYKGICQNLKPYKGKGVWYSNYDTKEETIQTGIWQSGNFYLRNN